MKKVIGFLTIVGVTVATFIASKSNSQNSNIDLASLVKINTASAECRSDLGGGGRCRDFDQYCVWDPWVNSCSWGW